MLMKEIPERKDINLRPETEFELSGRKEGVTFLFWGSLSFLLISSGVFPPQLPSFPLLIGTESINHSFLPTPNNPQLEGWI